jgi:hypothetical protein
MDTSVKLNISSASNISEVREEKAINEVAETFETNTGRQITK